jgi:hypothetical protein
MPLLWQASEYRGALYCDSFSRYTDLRRVTFATGEARLTTWMSENARICWTVHPRPWELEGQLIRDVSLPLNLDQNANHQFHVTLTRLRAEARARARALHVLAG